MHSSLKDRLHAYALLMRLNRPIGNFLLLWPTLWALWIAGDGEPNIANVAIFVLGVLIMRAAGCVINDYADRHVDGHVERTQHRPLATGRVAEKEALILFFGLCLLAFVLVLFTNRFTIFLSLGGVGLAALYPFMKRYTHFPQVFLGAAFAWAIPMAFAAETNALPPIAWWLFGITVLWALIYDTMYAMVDRDDDIKVGIKSTAVFFGRADRLVIGLFQIVMMGLLAYVGKRLQFGSPYFGCLLIACGLFVYQQWLIKDRQRGPCFDAFLNNNWFGGVIFLGIALDYATN